MNINTKSQYFPLQCLSTIAATQWDTRNHPAILYGWTPWTAAFCAFEDPGVGTFDEIVGWERRSATIVGSILVPLHEAEAEGCQGRPHGIGSRLPMEMEIPIGGSVWCQSEATTTNGEGCFPFFSTYHWQTQHWPDFKQPSLRDSRIGACGVTSCHDISAALNRGLRKFACLQTLKVLFVMCSNNLLTAIPKQIEHS